MNPRVAGWLTLVGLWAPAHAQWSALGTGMNGPVRALVYDSVQARLYAFGGFTLSGGLQTNGTTWWDGGQWHSMAGGTEQYAPILCAAQRSDELVIGGMFDNADSVAGTSYLARWNGMAWEPACDDGPVSGEVLGVAYIDSDLYVCGNFSALGSIPAMNVGYRHQDAWHSLLRPGLLLPYWNVSSVVKYQGSLFIAGNLAATNGIQNLGRVEGDSLVGVGTGVLDDAWVQDMAVYHDLLFVGGYFAQSAGNAGNMLMCWDGSHWFDPFPQVQYIGQAFQFIVDDDVLYISGAVRPFGEQDYYGIARYDGTQLCLMGGKGVLAQPMAIGGGKLYIGAGDAPLGPDSLDVNFIGALELSTPPDTCFNVVQSISHASNAPQCTISPNPCSDRLKVRSSMASGTSDPLLSLYDPTGQLLFGPIRSFRKVQGEVEFALPGGYHGLCMARIEWPGQGAFITKPVVIE